MHGAPMTPKLVGIVVVCLRGQGFSKDSMDSMGLEHREQRE